MYRACDRCHAIKEKCHRLSPSGACVRCDRLGHECAHQRPFGRMGRRSRPPLVLAKSHDAENTRKSTSPSPYSISPIGSSFLPTSPLSVRSLGLGIRNFSVMEENILCRALTDVKILEYQVIGPNFYLSERHMLIAHLESAIPILKDAVLASAMALLSPHESTGWEISEDKALAHATSSLLTFRNLNVRSKLDASLCAMLTLVLTTFAYHTSGIRMLNICRHGLGMISPFCHRLGEFEDSTLSAIASIALIEIYECLFTGELPTIRFDLQRPARIDQYLGLCWPLLPILYDICRANHFRRDQGDVDDELLLPQLNLMKEIVDKWVPILHNTTLSNREIIHILYQANIYRLMTLLIINRIERPAASGVKIASELSSKILRELSTAVGLIGRPLSYGTLPFMIAALELTDANERNETLENINQYVEGYAPLMREWMKEVLLRIWKVKDNTPNISWFHITHMISL